MSRLGFTLIELLIVITIIGILAVVFLPNILGAPAKARDATRQADVGNIVEAIEASRLDSTALPVASGCIVDKLPTGTYAKYFGGGIVPKDPGTATKLGACATDGQYTYQVYTSGYKYGVFARLEQTGKGNVDCAVATINTPAAPPTLVAGSGDCYGALSQ